MAFTATKQTDKVVLSVLHHKKKYLDFQGSGDLEFPKIKQPSF